VRLVAE